jgi:hypothetical protein
LPLAKEIGSPFLFSMEDESRLFGGQHHSPHSA